MLRSIGDIARAEGEDLRDDEMALSCLQVFALGGLKGEADAANSGYFAVRGLLAKSVAEAARFIVDRGVLAEGGPVLVRLLTQIASRFGVVVTQKFAAQAVPIVGALGGAAVNYAFIDHFQEIARGHFTVRRLERRYALRRPQRSLRPGRRVKVELTGTPSFRLDGRRALVTGAGRGIGLAAASALAEAGAVVSLAARTVGETEQAAALIRARGCATAGRIV
jgi:EcsC protein family/short chain dehydrogenase